MKTRSVHTKIWNDSWFHSLPKNSKLVFLYLLSNQYINLIGVFELPDHTICFDTGLSKSELEKAKKDLERKVIFYNDWIKIINVEKYDNFGNGKLLVAKERQIDELPEEIRKNIDTLPIGYDTLSIGYHTSNSNSNSNSKDNTNTIMKTKDRGIDTLTDDFCALVAKNYEIPLQTVLKKRNDLILYCRSKGKVYKDYQATLQLWVRKDNA